ncbi:MAG: cob(I)yrinic acid a,c-diamide adenosyltransferase [Alphaproteobacteria bacterium]|nr:cob(I)yrinic acid a,c-diamide adenosyltransferase [Alphaproteobacteria bacterium]
MVKLTKIYTRGGDEGMTSLVGGARVSKHHARMEAIGAVDEANAAIGVAQLHASTDTKAILTRIQHDLFDLGADLATPEKEAEYALRIQPQQVTRLEEEIDAVNAALSPLESFVLPAGSPASAHLHLARTTVRRAERTAFALKDMEELNPQALQYLNRLSDLLFVLARYENDDGKADVLWKPGATR